MLKYCYYNYRGAAVGITLSFVFSGVTALFQGEDYKDALLEGLKGGIGGVVAEASAIAVRQQFGESLLRDNVVTAIGFTAVFSIWDLAEWKLHEITAVEFRKHMASGN